MCYYQPPQIFSGDGTFIHRKRIMQQVKKLVQKLVVDGLLVLEIFPVMEMAVATLKVKPPLQWRGTYPLTTSEATELQLTLMKWFPNGTDRIIEKVLSFFN